MSWYQIYVGVLPLLGVIVGGAVTYFSQTMVINKQAKLEQEKEFEIKRVESLLVYNEILKLEGELQMRFYIGGGYIEFNLEAYREKIRPLLYSKYHLINQDIAQKVREMDNIINSAELYEELNQVNNDLLVNIFNTIIDLTEKHVKDYRIDNNN